MPVISTVARSEVELHGLGHASGRAGAVHPYTDHEAPSWSLSTRHDTAIGTRTGSPAAASSLTSG